MRITVFTPTYNRAYIIENLYRSLQRQTFRDFEWLIVDDGSSDNTEEVIAAWQGEGNDFPIRYYKKENGGKCQAINFGADRAAGELFFTVDSDDYLADHALEKVDRWERELPRDSKYCGVAGNLGTGPAQTPNRLFDAPYIDGTTLDRYEIADGERAMVFYTEIQRKYPYPRFPGEKFMTEAVSWNRMARDGYKMRYFNDIIWIYEYREDGLTQAGNSIFLRNPRGYGLFLREKAESLNWSKQEFLKMWYTFTCDMCHLYSRREIASFIDAPYPFIAGFFALHRLVGILRGGKGR